MSQLAINKEVRISKNTKAVQNYRKFYGMNCVFSHSLFVFHITPYVSSHETIYYLKCFFLVKNR